MIIRKQRYNIPPTTKEHPNTVFVKKENLDNNKKKDDIYKKKLKKIDLNSLL